jgi:membrane-associated phospholipid phosphatase
MEFLKLLEAHRTPFLDHFFYLATQLGSESLFILAGLIFFWCVSKKEGYYLLTVGFTGTILSQFLKLFCQIPRPWVRDPQFTIVESARAGATGYSFPSGHTQSAVGIYGSIARWHHNRILRGILIVIMLLVALSRMYLGVHTPADVLVGALISLVLIFGFYPLMQKADERNHLTLYILLIMQCLAGVYLLYVLLFPFPADIDTENLASATENAWTLFGALFGFLIAHLIDRKWLHFETRGSFSAQAAKLLLGAAVLLLLKAALKAPLLYLCNGNPCASGIRYFLVVLFAGAIWPATFPLWRRLLPERQHSH